MMFDDLHLDADVVAVAVVAAARNTHEDPSAISDRENDLRCRHFAFHALEHCFPKIDHARIAETLGCPGKPSYFRRSSLWYVLGQGPHRKTVAAWWSNEILADVIAAIAAACANRTVERTTPNTPTKEQMEAFAASHSLYVQRERTRRVDPDTVPDNPDLRPVGRSSPKPEIVKPLAPKVAGRDLYPPGKRNLYDELNAAVRNTAKMTPKE